MTTIPLSVNLMPTAPVGDLVELAGLAEALGCRRCWVYDEGLVTRDVYVTLSAIALATERLRLGPGITNPYVRHPGATAAAIATLDELSDGRAFLGLGAGGGLTLDPLGIERHRPLASVDAMVDSLRGLFAGHRVDRRGPTFSLVNARLDYGRADLEILLAGRGPKMMELAGRAADGFYLSYVHKDLLAEAVERVRRTPQAEGRPFTVVYSTMIATDDKELEAARAQLSFRLVDSPAEVRDRLGMGERELGLLRAALADGGPTAAAELVDPDWVPHFVITGSPRECAEELRTLMQRHSLDEFQLAVSDIGAGAELIERTAALFDEARLDDARLDDGTARGGSAGKRGA